MIDEAYAKRWYTYHMARGEVYKARHPEMIPLRAFLIQSEKEAHPGIALPDGRFIVAEGGSSIGSYSSEEVLLRHYPGAKIHWNPDADKTINHVEVSE